MTEIQTVAVILIAAGATILTRFLPYLIIPEGRRIPEFVRYLGKFLPPAVFGFLVVYCFRNVDFAGPGHGLPELIAAAVTAVLYFWRHGMVVPMLGGTACYMILVQCVFRT